MKSINDKLLTHLPLNSLAREVGTSLSRDRPVHAEAYRMALNAGAPLDKGMARRMRSGAGETGAAASGLTIVPDEFFGGCLYLDANATYPVDDQRLLKAIAESKGFSVCLWFYATSLDETPRGIVSLESAGGASLRGLIRKGRLSFSVNDHETPGHTELESETWYHLAFCHDGTRNIQTLFLNSRSECQTDQPLSFASTELSLYLGRGKVDSFVGKAANLRVYGEALSEEDLRQVYRDMDQSAQAGFRLAYPVDFRLYDGGFDNTLFISDKGTSRTFQLEIRNRSDRDMLLKGGNTGGKDFPYHFALEFRPGVIGKQLDPRRDILVPEQWKVEIAETGGRIRILFAYLDNSLNFAAGATLHFTVAYGSAAGSEPGGTTILLLYQGLFFPGYANPLKGSRIVHAEITNRSGRRKAPLYAGFIETDALINDGNPRAPLLLGIANTSTQQDIALWSKGGTRPARFSLSLMWGPQDLSLCDDNDMRQIDVDPVRRKAATPGEWELDLDWEKRAPSGQGDYQWEFLPRNDKRLFKAGEVLHLRISRLGTTKTIGRAPVTLRYEGLPEYWDGQLTIDIRKGPVASHDGRVGIGTDRPEAKLHILDEEHTPGVATLMLGHTEGSRLGMGCEADHTWIQSAEASPLVLNPSGSRVGIGTETPTAALEVKGGIVSDGFESKGRIRDQTGFVMPVGAILAYGGGQAPEGWLLCDGREIPDVPEYRELRAVVGAKTPDLRLRTIIGSGANEAVCPRPVPLNETGGEWSHALSVSEMPPHAHAYHKAEYNYGHRNGHGDWSRYGHQDQPNNGTTTTAGEGQAHTNMPPYYALNYIIKY